MWCWQTFSSSLCSSLAEWWAMDSTVMIKYTRAKTLCSQRKLSLWSTQITQQLQILFLIPLVCFMRCDVIHVVSHLLCANISKCCSSKILGTVSCRNNATWHTFQFCHSLKGKSHHSSRGRGAIKANSCSAIWILHNVLTSAMSGLIWASLCLPLLWQPALVYLTEGDTSVHKTTASRNQLSSPQNP